jgi:hypothetical protein
MIIKSNKQKRLNKQVLYSKLLSPRLLIVHLVALATVGAAVMVYFLVPSADIIKLQANEKQMHKYQVSSELPNKRQLIATLQSIRMHNVTRYQRTDSKNLEQSSIRIAKIDASSDNLALPPRVSHSNNEHLNTSASRAAPVRAVQQGW